MNPNGPIENPDLRAILNAHRDEIFAALNCHQTGTIVSFDATKQTATVSINTRRVVYDRPQTENGALQQSPRLVDYPLLTDVPVFFASGGSARLTLPIAAGDTCLILFNDRDLDAWWSSGQVVEPNSSRMHSLSDAMAIVGIRSQGNKVEDYEEENAVLRLGDSLLRIKPDGAVEVEREGVVQLTVEADGSVSAIANGASLRLASDGSVTISAGGAGIVIDPSGAISAQSAYGSAFQLAEQVAISSAARSLKSALDAVVTALTALNAKTGPDASAAIASAASAIDEVLS